MGLPPTTSKVSGDTSDKPTFKFRFPNFTGTRTGTTTSLDLLSVTGGGTGLSTVGTESQVLKVVAGAPKWSDTPSVPKNYIAETDGTLIGSWTTYADAAATSPVDGTGGSPASTFAVSTDSTLRGTTNFLWTHSAANRQGEGFSYAFTIDPADKGKVLQCSFEYLISSGTYADDDMSFWIYDVTNARIIQPSPYLLKNSGIIEKFAIEFQTSIDSTSYRLIGHVASTSALAYTIRFDNFNISAQAKLYGSPITDWVDFTPTFAGVTAGTSVGTKWRRNGCNMEMIGSIVLGTSTGGTTFALTIPGSLAVASSITNPNTAVGNIVRGSGGGGATKQITILATSGSTTLAGGYGDNVDAINPLVATTNTNLFATGSTLSLNISVPIAGWSSSQVMSSDADTRVVMFSGSSTTGTAVTANVTDVPFTSLKDSHAGWSGTAYVVKVPGDYIISTSLTDSASGNIATDVYINASLRISKISFSVGGQYAPQGCAILYDLKAGDSVTIRSSGTVTLTTGTRYISISRIAGPAQIAASESVSALYTGAPATGTLDSFLNTDKTRFGTKVKDTHNSYASGVYTIPVSGTYSVSSKVKIDGTYALNKYLAMAIYIDGALTYANDVIAGGALSTSQGDINIHSIPLKRGQTVEIHSASDATTPTYSGYSGYSYFSIVRTGNY